MAKIQMSEVDPGLLRAAQQAHGYSDRVMASRLALGTEKTWWRWRTEGRVPTSALPAIALVLELPELLEEFQSRTPHNGEAHEVSELAAEVAAVRAQLAEVLALLRERDAQAQ